MGNRDQGPGALVDAQPEEIHPTVFRDDVVDVPTARHHTSARGERRHDAAHGAVVGGAGEGDDGAPAAAARGTPDEVDLAADAREQVPADGIGIHLPGEIDLEGAVDGHRIVVL